MAKRNKHHMFTEAQSAALIQHEQVHGHGRHAAKLALKLAAFRYPGAPKRSIGSIANKLWTLHTKRLAFDKSTDKAIVSKVDNKIDTEEDIKPLAFSFKGYINGEMFEMTISGRINQLKGLL